MKITPQFDPSSLSQADSLNPVQKVGTDQGTGAVSTASGFQPGSASAVSNDGATLASSVVALAAQALQQPDVRQDRVSQLRSQISAGTYQVSPSQVAAAMLADPLTGLGSGKSD